MAKKTKEKVDLLGTIELLVLNAVTRLDEAYGASVFESILEVYPPISVGSVYTTLERLTWKGYLTGEMGAPEPVRGGRARKYYQVTALGQKVLAATHDTIDAARSIERPARALIGAPATPGERRR